MANAIKLTVILFIIQINHVLHINYFMLYFIYLPNIGSKSCYYAISILLFKLINVVRLQVLKMLNLVCQIQNKSTLRT